MIKVLYAGSFDPVTFGHIDIIERASKMFDKVIVGVGVNQEKRCTFSTQERIEMLEKCTSKLGNVSIESFKGLVVKFAKKNKCNVILRGMRVLTDFDFEFQMALTNKDVSPDIETVFLLTAPNHIFISSSMVKELAFNGGDVSKYAPSFVTKKLKDKFF